MKNDKSQGNGRITKEFYEFFCDDIRNSLSDLIKKSSISDVYLTKTSCNQINRENN